MRSHAFQKGDRVRVWTEVDGGTWESAVIQDNGYSEIRDGEQTEPVYRVRFESDGVYFSPVVERKILKEESNG